MSIDAQPLSWLLLVHQLPAKPAYLRVKTWRRMQALGAVTLKGSVYVLPRSDGAQEDLEWVLREVLDGGGEGMILEARLIDGLTNDEVVQVFKAAREADYRALAAEVQALAAGSDSEEVVQAQLARLRKRFDQVAAIDFFDAESRRELDGQIHALAARQAGSAFALEDDPPVADLSGRTWVTRSGVHVDRIACAWLIRRFIDPRARFKFVAAKGYEPQPGELRFDMFDAEFTHEGDSCSFETLLSRRRIIDPALRAIGEIIHDIDVKDDKFRRPETAGIAHLIDGVTAAHQDDEQRIARGDALLDDLYVFFQGKGRAA